MAEKEYQKGEYGTAGKLYDKLATDFPESESWAKYKFLADMCNMQTTVSSATNRENPDSAIKKLEEFIDTHFKSELAKHTTGFGNEIFKAGEKVEVDISIFAGERIKAYQADRSNKAAELERTEKAIAQGRALFVKLEPYRSPEAAPLDRIRKDFDAIESQVNHERERTAELAKAADILSKQENITDAVIQAVEADLAGKGYLSDPEAQGLIAVAKGKLQALVKYVSDPLPPIKVPQASIASLLFVTPIGRTQIPLPSGGPEVPPSIFLGVARGILYAIDENTGSMLWAVRIGQEITDPPTVAKVDRDAGPVELAVVTSNAGGEAGVAAYALRTGEALWYQSLPAPAAGPAVVVGNRAFIPVRDSLGTIYEFDLDTGYRKGRIRMGQPAGPGAVLRPGTNLLYVAAEARRIFVIDVALRDENGIAKTPQCVQVIATGHPAGTLRTPPVVIGPEGDTLAERWMMLSQATGSGTMKIRIFPVLPIQPLGTDGKLPPETVATPAAELPLQGWAWFPPATDGERLAVVSDVGQARFFELKNPSNFDRPLFSVPEPHLPLTPDGTPSCGLVFPGEEAAFWVLANGTMQKFRLGLVPSRGYEMLASPQQLSLGEAIQPPQFNARKDSAFLVVRSLNSDGYRAVLIGLRDGVIRWQRQLGIAPATTSIPQGSGSLIVSKDGGLIEVPLDGGAAIGQGKAVPESWLIAPPYENATSVTSVAVSSDGKTVYTVTQILASEELKLVPKYLIRRIVGGKVVHEGSVAARPMSNGQPAPLAGPPVVLGDSLVLPLADGFVYRHTAGTGKSNPDSIADGPSWSGDQRIDASTRCYLTPLSETAFLTSNGSKKLTKWEWPKDGRWSPVSNWELRDQPTGAGMLIPPPSGSGPARLLVADASGSVSLYPNDRGGAVVKRWLPGSELIPAGKPTSALMMQLDGNNKPVVAYTIDDKYLVCLDLEKDKTRWVVPMGDDVEGTLVGAPQAVGGGRWAVTDLGGRVAIYDSSAGKPVGSVAIGVRFKLTDDSLAALAQATMPETTQSKLKQFKDKEMSREELSKEVAKALSPQEQDEWKRSILINAAFGLSGALPDMAASHNGSYSILIPFSDGSIVIIPAPSGPAPAPEPKPKE